MSTRTSTSGSTFNIRMRGGSMPKSRMSKRDCPASVDGLVVDPADGHLVLVAAGHAPEGDLAADPVAAVGVRLLHRFQHPVDRRVRAGRRCASAAPGPPERFPDDSRRTGSDSWAAGLAARSTPPSGASSRSTYPSSPSVVEWIGCTLDRALIDTVERSGTIR